MARHAMEALLACVAALCSLLATAGCDSGDPAAGMSPTNPSPPMPLMLSGRVFEVIPGGRVPASDFSVIAIVSSGNCPAVVCFSSSSYHRTTSGPDGRYQFPNLPDGSASVIANSATHRQVCGAFAVLSTATELDVEITLRANPQPSPTMPPLRVTGQIYEHTPTGRVGLDGAEMYIERTWPESNFLTVYPDKDGRYTACGIPANTLLAFGIEKTEYVGTFSWYQFGADTTLDIGLKRP